MTGMRAVSVRRADGSAVLGDRVRVAESFWTRLRGLLGRPALEPGEGLLIVPSSGVHMFGMRQALDVALLDRDDHVVATYPELRPWRATSVHREARCALELPPGTLERTGTGVGDRLVIRNGH